MNILIIGGTALVGPHVIHELMQNSANRVYTLTRGGASYYCEQTHTGDRRDAALLKQVISEVQPNILVDMIPFTQEDANLVVETLSTLNISIPVVAISSMDVYAAYASLHKTEAVPIQPYIC